MLVSQGGVLSPGRYMFPPSPVLLPCSEGSQVSEKGSMPLCVALFGHGGSRMSFLKLRTAGNMRSQRKPARSSLLFQLGEEAAREGPGAHRWLLQPVSTGCVLH